MQTSKILQFSTVGETHINQENVTQVELVRAESNETEPEVAFVPDYTLFWIPLGFMMVWIIIVLMTSDFWTVARHGILSVKHLQQVPCKSCQFFKNNPYLQCAVHPSRALTAEAVNCSDYCPLNRFR